MSGKEQQRGRMVDRFIVIPFSSNCRSASSVDVVVAQQQASRHANKQPQQAQGEQHYISSVFSFFFLYV